MEKEEEEKDDEEKEEEQGCWSVTDCKQETGQAITRTAAHHRLARQKGEKKTDEKGSPQLGTDRG